MPSPNAKNPPYSQSPPVNFLPSSTPNSTPPPPNHLFNPLLAFQQMLQQQQQQQTKSKADEQCNSACSSPGPLIDDQLSPPLSINLIVNKSQELIKPESNAMFMRVWDRGSNICSRTDLEFRYLPNSKYLKEKQERKAKEKVNIAKPTPVSMEQSTGFKIFNPQVVNSAKPVPPKQSNQTSNQPLARNLQSPTTPALKQLRDIADRSNPFNQGAAPQAPGLFFQNNPESQGFKPKQNENMLKPNLNSPNLFPPPPFGPFGAGPPEAFLHLISQFQHLEKTNNEIKQNQTAPVPKQPVVAKTPEALNTSMNNSNGSNNSNNNNNSNHNNHNKKNSSSLKSNNNNSQSNIKSNQSVFNTPTPSRPSSSLGGLRQTNSPFANKPPIPSSPISNEHQQMLLAQQQALLSNPFANIFGNPNQGPQSPNLMRMQQQRPPSQPPQMFQPNPIEIMERERQFQLFAAMAQAQLAGAHPGPVPPGIPGLPNEEALRLAHLQFQQQQQQKEHFIYK